MRLEGKVAIITGAGSGIGRASADEFVRDGAQVVVADIDERAGRETAAEIGQERAVFVPVDTTSPESVEALVQDTLRRFGKLDIMFNNAGIGAPFLSVLDLPVEEYLRVIAVNQNGYFYGIKAAAAAMKDRGGVIINTASVYGVLAAHNQLPYSASKGAVILMTQAAARDLARYNIRVVAIAPGLIDTPFSRIQLDPPGFWDALERAHLRRQAGTPEDVAKLAAFLASDDAQFLNGHVYFADDGYASFKP